MENLVYQYRWYNEGLFKWAHWETCTEEKYNEIVRFIQRNLKFQARILVEKSIQGYMIPVPTFDQAEFDIMVEKGTAAWADVNIDDVRDNDGC